MTSNTFSVLKSLTKDTYSDKNKKKKSCNKEKCDCGCKGKK
jgi:hypothetical protein